MARAREEFAFSTKEFDNAAAQHVKQANHGSILHKVSPVDVRVFKRGRTGHWMHSVYVMRQSPAHSKVMRVMRMTVLHRHLSRDTKVGDPSSSRALCVGVYNSTLSRADSSSVSITNKSSLTFPTKSGRAQGARPPIMCHSWRAEYGACFASGRTVELITFEWQSVICIVFEAAPTSTPTG